jgi:hypothetical protein
MSTSTVTSEALQFKLRQLLPSQQGFGTDLSASDTIIPIVDLTAAAEGSDVSQTLQQALAFGSQNVFQVSNQTSTVINTVGFFRVTAVMNIQEDTIASETNAFSLTDGATVKEIFEQVGGRADGGLSEFYDFVVFLAAGESLTATSSSATTFIRGSYRQIADANGVLVQPSGFNPQ